MFSQKLSRREMLKLAGMTAAGAILAACGGPATPEATAVPTNVQEVQLPTAEVLEGFTPKMANPSEKITIVYWWGNNYEPALQFTNEIIARFSLAYPNVTIEPVAGQNCDAFVTAAAAGTPPDVFHTWDCVERMGNWAKRGIIIPLDDYITASGFDLNDFMQGIQDTCIMDGKTWGIVDTAGVFLLWGRPDIYTAAGKDAAGPKDTDEMWAWCRELTTKGADGSIERMGLIMPNWVWTYFAWVVNFGGEVWDTQNNMPTPDHPGVVAALQDFVEQVKYFGIDEITAWGASIGSQSGEQDPFLAGNAVFQIDGDWGGQRIFDFHPDWEIGKDYAVSAPPPPPASKQKGESAVAFWSWPWVIPSGTKYPDWSWEVLRFYKSPEYAVNVHAKFKEIVTQKSMINDERLWWPAAKVAGGLVKEGTRKLTTVMPMNPWAGEYTNLLGEAFERVKNLAETPEESMARVKGEVLKLMQEG